uniref:Uncharacterized protein n=1 Tax=Anguilla anguilla TaxID=7936 RepID=A0A0E9SSZ1_ANGAN
MSVHAVMEHAVLSYEIVSISTKKEERMKVKILQSLKGSH